MKLSRKAFVSICALGAALSQTSAAQDRPRVAAGAVPKTTEAGQSLEQIGRVIDRASFLPEFQKALRPDNAKEIRSILIANGLPRDIPVKDAPPAQFPVQPGNGNCFTTPIKVYYPKPPYSWPNNWRIAIAVVCWTDAGGQLGYWD